MICVDNLYEDGSYYIEDESVEEYVPKHDMYP